MLGNDCIARGRIAGGVVVSDPTHLFGAAATPVRGVAGPDPAGNAPAGDPQTRQPHPEHAHDRDHQQVESPTHASAPRELPRCPAACRRRSGSARTGLSHTLCVVPPCGRAGAVPRSSGLAGGAPCHCHTCHTCHSRTVDLGKRGVTGCLGAVTPVPHWRPSLLPAVLPRRSEPGDTPEVAAGQMR
jgi:hypothetical protein